MDLDPTQTALKTWIAQLTGIVVQAVLLENEPRPRTVDGTVAYLSWVSDVGVGIDETRYDVDDAIAPPNDNVTPVVVGDRVVALQVSLETLSQAAAAPNGHALAMRLRDRLRLPSSLAALRAMNLGLIEASPITKADYRVDTRWISRSIVELRFNATSVERDTGTGGPTTTIDSVDVTSHLADVDAAQLPAALQMVAVDIPDAEGTP